jgi:putative FmdB family regulatory protein
MPTYDFRCAACGLVFEAKRGFSEAGEPAPCPRDGSPAGRLFSPPADVLVRGGFREALDRSRAVAARPRWSHDDASCHTHAPAPIDHGPGGSDRHHHEHRDVDGRGRDHGPDHRHGRGHPHAH